jgi:hypothetical protein
LRDTDRRSLCLRFSWSKNVFILCRAEISKTNDIPKLVHAARVYAPRQTALHCWQLSRVCPCRCVCVCAEPLWWRGNRDQAVRNPRLW